MSSRRQSPSPAPMPPDRPLPALPASRSPELKCFVSCAPDGERHRIGLHPIVVPGVDAHRARPRGAVDDPHEPLVPPLPPSSATPRATAPADSRASSPSAPRPPPPRAQARARRRHREEKGAAAKGPASTRTACSASARAPPPAPCGDAGAGGAVGPGGHVASAPPPWPRRGAPGSGPRRCRPHPPEHRARRPP